MCKQALVVMESVHVMQSLVLGLIFALHLCQISMIRSISQLPYFMTCKQWLVVMERMFSKGT